MKVRKYRYFACDFETTVYKGQVNTEVWASAIVELGSEDVKILHSIGELFDYMVSLDSNIIAYFHNLKFDGAFWLSYLLVDLGLEQAYQKLSEKEYDIVFSLIPFTLMFFVSIISVAFYAIQYRLLDKKLNLS